MTNIQEERAALPRVGVGALVIKDDHVLLVKRKYPPAAGYWAIPGGGLKAGERLHEAAEREVLEETGIHIKAGSVVYVFDMIDRDEAGRIRYHYVIIDMKADYLGGQIKAADDAQEARWVHKNEWRDLDLYSETRRFLDAYLNH